jgi:hypothetical protein
MNPELHAAALHRLIPDFSFKEKGERKWLTEGVCPLCQKKTVYAVAESPWILRCNRLNHCGYEEHLKDLYPDLFETWTDRHPKTPQNPHAAADAYLSIARGFDLAKIKGLYTQEAYWDHKTNQGSSTVRFQLGGGVWWERIIDRPHRFGKRKATFHGEYGGLWWAPPDLVLENQEKIYLTEGIFDTLSFHLNGYASVAIMSTSNYPALALEGLKARCADKGRPELVWSLDCGKAGQEANLKFIARACAEGWPCSCLQTEKSWKGKETDWNDLHLLGKINDETLVECLYRGALLTAPNALEKALLIHHKKNWQSFSLDHGQRLHWYKLHNGDYTKEFERLGKEQPELDEEARKAEATKKASQIEEIATCHPVPLYSQRNELTDERWFYFRIELPHEKKPVKNTFTASQLTTPMEFQKRLLNIADGVWTGNKYQLDRLLKRWTANLKAVHAVDFVGYAREYKTYVYGKYAIHNGKLYEANDEDFFDLPKLAVKTIARSIKLDINPNLADLTLDWVPWLWDCYGVKGIAALAWWFGSLFAEQIRERNSYWPFLEIIGEAGSGKSTLLRFLWKLFGRDDYEGVDPNKGTFSGRSRSYAQVANLPIVLIESDREYSDHPGGRPYKGFDFSEFKSASDGGTLRLTGARTGGNETIEAPFRAALCISQNNPITSPEPIVQRILHLWFDCKGHNAHTKSCIDRLEALTVEQLSGFLVKAATHEKAVMDQYATRFPVAEKTLQDQVRNFRIAKGHGQLTAMLHALTGVFSIPEHMIESTLAYIKTMAAARQQAIAADHPIVQDFWDIYEFIEETCDRRSILNHSNDDRYIAVNLVHFYEVAMARRSVPPPMGELKRFLKTSRAHKYVENKVVRSAIYGCDPNNTGDSYKSATVNCWIFLK